MSLHKTIALISIDKEINRGENAT